jgi:GDP-L-fucose synthase
MNRDVTTFVAGHRGLVGSAIVRCLESRGVGTILSRSSAELDLRNQRAVEDFFAAERPARVFLAAAKVGGIHANETYAAEFIRDNLQIQTNVIDAAYRHGTQKLLFLGSSCIYPKFAPQPIPESSLLTGPLEATNQWYAIAKIAGLKMCQAYRRQYGFNAISAMPTNLYGPGDNFDLHSSHVLPALMRKFHEAAQRGDHEAVVWGTGTPRREFLHVDDLADACVFLMEHYEGEDCLNVGWGKDVSIRELAELVASVVGFSGVLRFDETMPDGTPRKLLDVSKLAALGWRPRIALREGIELTYRWLLGSHGSVNRTSQWLQHESLDGVDSAAGS